MLSDAPRRERLRRAEGQNAEDAAMHRHADACFAGDAGRAPRLARLASLAMLHASALDVITDELHAGGVERVFDTLERTAARLQDSRH